MDRRMTAKEIKNQNKYLREQNKKYPDYLVEVPKEEWPKTNATKLPYKVLRSNRHLVLLYNEGEYTRMTVSRTMINADGEWESNISWEQLQELKNEAGFIFEYGVEVFPPEDALVNVANMRHIWILPQKPDFGW